MIRQVAVFGATGSIGRSALDLIHLHPDRYRASVLTAYRNVEALAKLCVLHRPDLAIIADPALEAELARRLAAAGVRCEIASGPEAMALGATSTRCDIVITAITGLAGMEVTLAAARASKRVLQADRASATVAGPLLRQALAEGDGEWVPLNPELHAAYQCLSQDRARSDTARLTLVGPGGPLLGRHRAELMTVIPDQVCKPSDRPAQRLAAVNSASLLDRGLQVIAAHSLFQLAPERIKTLIHPQGQVYALVEHGNRSMRVQAGDADRHSILAQALISQTCASPPECLSDAPVDTEKPDMATFRCLALAYQAARAGGDAPVILNAASEVAAEAFLAGALPFLSMADLIEQVLMELPPQAVVDIPTLHERDRAARTAARRVLRNAC